MFPDTTGAFETLIELSDDLVPLYHYAAVILLSLAAIFAAWWLCRRRTLRTGGARAMLLAALGLLSAAFTADWLAENPHYGYITKEGLIEPWLAAYLPTIWAIAAAALLGLRWARRLGVRKQKPTDGEKMEVGKVTDRTFVGAQAIRSSRVPSLFEQQSPDDLASS
jgi:hypothetical protein